MGSNADLVRNTHAAEESRRLRAVRVRAVHDISQSMRRVTLGGDELETLQVTKPCEWAKIFLPKPAIGAPQVGRAYTLRGHRPERNEVDIDVVIHSEGPLSNWARDARIGDEVFLAGPRGGFLPHPTSNWIFLVADASALPAMASILESLHGRVQVFGFVLADNFQDLDLLPTSYRHSCNWTDDGVDSLLGMVRSADTPSCAGEVWAAGEASLVRAIRNHFVIDRKLPKTQVRCSGYWKRGSQDHRDSDQD